MYVKITKDIYDYDIETFICYKGDVIYIDDDEFNTLNHFYIKTVEGTPYGISKDANDYYEVLKNND